MRQISQMLRSAWTRLFAKAAATPLLYTIDALSRFVIGRPTRLLDPGGFSFRDSRKRERVDAAAFAPDPRLAVILTFGQSQMANEGASDGLFVPKSGVFNFNWLDGHCYVARDPLLGTTMDRSNFTTRLADHLVRSGVYDRVLLVPIAHGGTMISQWVPGSEMFRRISVALHGLNKHSIVITHALWQQGESDAGKTSTDDWIIRFDAMVSALRLAGMSAPIFVAQSTRCASPPNETIRAAQRAVVDPSKNILPGPDTDAMGSEYRWDDCHYSAEGLSLAAEGWFQAITNVPKGLLLN
ncbi:MAG TPA: sialate O-acetylesterase [Beijerinckiaceae bacterium]|nr:sialate O-acetylesterase [Beijerinckiaceae bacterium]